MVFTNFADGCCFSGRPPLERLRNICITCLCLDSIFVLLYGLTAMKPPATQEQEACYQQHHYIWHNIVSICYAVSTVVAILGIANHSTISCAPSLLERQLLMVSRYAHGMVCWILIQALLKAVADRQEPPECRAPKPVVSDEQERDEESGRLIWDVGYIALWLSWVSCSVAAAMLARRCMPLVKRLAAEAAGAEQASAQNALEPGTMPQTVGMPVQFPPMGSAAGPAEYTQGVAAAGFPAAGVTGWHNGSVVAAGGGMVVEGHPVANSTPDPDKGGGSGSQPKVV